MPFKLNQDRRYHSPRQRHRVTNWPAYDASLRQRGSLTVWVTDEATAAWAAEPRTTRGGQPWYSPLAILTAPTLRAVFHLAYRQAEGLIGSVIGLLGLALRVPDHTTLSRRAATLEVPRSASSGAGGRRAASVHLLVDSTGLRLCGAGEWLTEKHGPARAGGGRSYTWEWTTAPRRPLCSTRSRARWPRSPATADTTRTVSTTVPPRATAVPSDTAETVPTQRDRYLRCIAEHGRMGWQKRSGHTKRARAEAAIGRWKQGIGDALRSRTDERRATEVAVAVHALNRMLELGRPISVRTA